MDILNYIGGYFLVYVFLVIINKPNVFLEFLIKFVVLKVDDLNWFKTKGPQKNITTNSFIVFIKSY
ncbi:hypothetical protein CF129_01490 [Aeromonas dhakensis]|nr:hypothetical protein CF129_01490 [Aeromonas dhakensis]